MVAVAGYFTLPHIGYEAPVAAHHLQLTCKDDQWNLTGINVMTRCFSRSYKFTVMSLLKTAINGSGYPHIFKKIAVELLTKE